MNWFTQKIMGLFGKSGTDISEATDDTPDYSGMKVAELKTIAKERGVKGYYKLKKADLISTLNNQQAKK